MKTLAQHLDNLVCSLILVSLVIREPRVLLYTFKKK